MIVIGAHGWSRARRVLHGSVSTAVVHRLPVLVVPSDAREIGRPGEPIFELVEGGRVE